VKALQAPFPRALVLCAPNTNSPKHSAFNSRLAYVSDEAARETVAKRACRAGEIIHNEPYPVDAPLVVAALKAMDRYGAEFDHQV